MQTLFLKSLGAQRLVDEIVDLICLRSYKADGMENMQDVDTSSGSG